MSPGDPSTPTDPLAQTLAGEATPPPGVDAVERACADMVRRWRRGERVPVEAYLEVEPALAGDGGAVLDLIDCERALRREAGEAPVPEEYLGRFPAHAEALRRQFGLDGLIEGPGDDPGDERTLVSGTDPPPESTLPMPPSSPTARPWPEIPGFVVEGELGRGGMGVVYRARQVGLRRTVALKMIVAGDHAGPAAAARFRAEAEAVARLHHPHVVQVHAVGEHDGHPYLVLEYVDGGSLADRLDGTPRPPREAARLVEAAARGIAEAHRLGVVHRDLKPANILMAGDGTPKIADFGLAKLLDSDADLTRTGTVLGSPCYMAPEQAGGAAAAIGRPADIYALGVILYELLTGRPPFRAATIMQTLELVRSADPVPPSRQVPGVPRDLETIGLKCLEKEPDRRYASAADLADDLRRFVDHEPIRARPVSGPERAWRSPPTAGPS